MQLIRCGLSKKIILCLAEIFILPTINLVGLYQEYVANTWLTSNVFVSCSYLAGKQKGPCTLKTTAVLEPQLNRSAADVEQHRRSLRNRSIGWWKGAACYTESCLALWLWQLGRGRHGKRCFLRSGVFAFLCWKWKPAKSGWAGG